MSQPMRENPEGYTSRPSEMAWGCVQTNGWVPFPKDIPRRHALLDNVGRTDDPCDRPKFSAPSFAPQPAFKPPREGYPNNMCNREDYGSQNQNDTEDENVPEGAMVVNVGQGTPQAIHLRLPPAYSTPMGEDDGATLNDCCQESRSLDAVRQKYEDIVGPLEERESGHGTEYAKCQSQCRPLVPKYPCRGVISSPREGWSPVPLEKRCKPLSLQSNETPGKWNEQKPINGWEFIERCKTCDYYPIDSNLPGRFNNPVWFKGYGCERPVHPFYMTTGAEYGRFGPNPHTMTQKYHPRSSEFTEILGITGMYRNRTLNTSNNKTIV